MTLEEAIKNEEEAVEGNEKLAEFYYKEPGRNTALGNACRELADERRQLAAWLTELKQYKDYNVGEFCDKVWKRGYERGKAETIKALAPITPQPKMGRWIRWYEQREHDCGIEYIPHCKCSECGKEYDSHLSQFIKYCNECGAKMQEVEE